jgi:MFS family permease
MSKHRSFHSLVATQFLTVFNDNLFKQSVLLIAVSHAAVFPEMQSWTQALFSAPFFIFAAFAGELADRHSKRNIIIACKYIEALIMLVAAVCFYLQSNTALLIVVALMGTQSAFLGPAKYGAIRDYRNGDKLAHANGVFQAFVLFGILLGTGSAGHLASDNLWLLGIAMAVVAVLGGRVAAKMRHVEPHSVTNDRPSKINPLSKLVNGFNYAKQFSGLRSALVGHAAFWLCGSWMLLAWNEFLIVREDGTSIVALSKGAWSLGLASLSVFMGLGAYICGRLLKQQLHKTVPLIGGLGMAVGLSCCGLYGDSELSIWLSLSLASFFSGFYLIPLRCFVQHTSPANYLGSLLGLSQMLDFGFILVASLIRPLLLELEVDANLLLICAAAVMVVSCLGLSKGLPQRLNLSRV